LLDKVYAKSNFDVTNIALIRLKSSLDHPFSNHVLALLRKINNAIYLAFTPTLLSKLEYLIVL